MRIVITVAALLAAAPAYAFPPVGDPVNAPLILTGNGQVAAAIFAFKDAADSSDLNLTSPPFGLVFNNSVAAPGDLVLLGTPVGSVVFELHDLTTGNKYTNDTADAFGDYHFFATEDYADFGVGAINAAVQAAIDGLPVGTLYTFVGVEDRNEGEGSDFDYNDLIYIFSQIEARQEVPAPGMLALFGLGLAGLGLARRRG